MFFMHTITLSESLDSMAKPMRLGSFPLLTLVVAFLAFLVRMFHILELLLLCRWVRPCMKLLVLPWALSPFPLGLHSLCKGGLLSTLGLPLSSSLLLRVTTVGMFRHSMGTLLMLMILGIPFLLWDILRLLLLLAAALAICDAPGPSRDDHSPASEIISQQLPFLHPSAGGLDSESEASQGSKKSKQSFKRRSKASVTDEDAPMEEVPLEEEAQGSQAADADVEVDFFSGFESFHEVKKEEPSGGELRDLEDDEIAQQVGEYCPPGAAPFVRANSLRDPPPGLGGMFKDSEGLSRAVCPPILVLARQSFFKPSATDDPQFEPGFYCLFCKTLKYRGNWGRPFSDFLARSMRPTSCFSLLS